MQIVNLTKANVQDGIRLVKEGAQLFNKESSIEEINKTLMIAVAKVRMRSSGEVRDVMLFGKVESMVDYPTTPIAVFNVKTYHGFVETMGTESVARITNEFYKNIQEKLSE